MVGLWVDEVLELVHEVLHEGVDNVVLLDGELRDDVFEIEFPLDAHLAPEL